MKKDYKKIYFYLDDSGALSYKEDILVYGGILFINDDELKSFYLEYHESLKIIKYQKEIKSYNISYQERRYLLKKLNKYYKFGLIIYNKTIYAKIMKKRLSKGRIINYAIKRLIKEIIIDLIAKKIINKDDNLELIIGIDKEPKKENGFYNLKESIKEELLYGITNIKNNIYFKPILKGKLKVIITYYDSQKNLAIQAADIISGSIRKAYLNNHLSFLKKIETIIFIPHK